METGQYFGTSQNRIEDKQSGTEGVIILKYNFSLVSLKRIINYQYPNFIGRLAYLFWSAFGLRVHVYKFTFFVLFFCFARIFWLWETIFTVMNSVYTVYVLKNIKNGSHDTIYIFKYYFATMFSVFSFQFPVFSNNKFNPNTPLFVQVINGNL